MARSPTKVTHENGVVTMTLYSTPVVRYDFAKKSVTLNTGGYRTVTTKSRMNQFARDYSLPFSVFQRNHAWFVSLKDGTQYEFEDRTITFQV